jgi:hypothetical protein
MSLRIARAGLAFVLAFPCVAFGAFAAGGSSPVIADAGNGDIIVRAQPNDSAFKLKAGGQIDIETSTVSFAGQATHLGQFTAIGTYDPDRFAFQGIMIGASGDTVSFTATFEPQPSGEIVAYLTFLGNPGRRPLFLATGEGVGMLVLDDDYMFTLDIEGTFRKCERDFTHSCL